VLYKIVSYGSSKAVKSFLLFLRDLKVQIAVISEFCHQGKLNGSAVEEALCFNVKEGSL
jgi:hypothetical protein